ncbi:hypothetical protein ASF03_13775 [Rhizobium sp. Leaf68]|nr:hypothetical protein ASE62_13095 [Rhizobium sp. Leaf202]KQN84318.1 hypothetical protein ASF03_13775 [Rhizobium sp. Leaf68]
MANLIIESWRPVRLILDEIGPFRQGQEIFEFDGVSEDGSRVPANLYMLLARNGRGKTTALEAIYGLFGMMADPPVGRFMDVRTGGRAQLDIRVVWSLGSSRQSAVLSLWTGSDDPMGSWTEDALAAIDADVWERLHLSPRDAGVRASRGSTEGAQRLFDEIASERGRDPSLLYGGSQTLPTVLYFPADRRIVAPIEERAVKKPAKWGYQPAQMFSSDGPDWDDSIDNLLIWLEWVEDGRIEDLLTFLNEQLFADVSGKVIRRPRRHDLATYVSNVTGEHTLVGLSHGERALLQLHARTLCHMTSSTILLIDELENHLHPRWAQRLFASLKEIVSRSAMLSVIFTTHSMGLMETFRDDVAEPGVVKGGYLIEDSMV